MVVRGKNLPQWLQKVVEQRCIEQSKEYDPDCAIDQQFTFIDTPEGWGYWRNIADGLPLPSGPIPEITVIDYKVPIHITHFKYDKEQRKFTTSSNELEQWNDAPFPLMQNHLPSIIRIYNPITTKSVTFEISAMLRETGITYKNIASGKIPYYAQEEDYKLEITL